MVRLGEWLKDKISVLTGSSGVGKSSLLNAVQPGLGLRVRDVSQATDKGLHTTRHVELVPLSVGGYVADTPGIRALAVFDMGNALAVTPAARPASQKMMSHWAFTAPG